MSKNVQACSVLQTPFMQELRCAFKHIPAVNLAFHKNDYTFFMGCEISDLTDKGITFEEYFCRNLLKKVENVSVPNVDPTENAKELFLAFLERQREKTPYVEALLEQVDTTTSVGRVLIEARRALHDLLGDFKAYTIKPRFTGGATVDLTKIEGSNPFKRARSSSGYDVIEKRRKSYFEKYGLTEMWPVSDDLPVSPGCDRWEVVIDFVSKTWKVDRVIGKQLVVPLAYQTGTGDWLASKASQCGLHISTAQELHKDIARMSSLLDDHLMTLDQSNASDNIVYCLVKYLVPTVLYDWLWAITPRDIIIDDVVIPSVDMMATAGNGYIFPLQTLIFWAIAKATCKECGVEGEVYSYGDDLIAPKAIASQLEQVFNLLGLQVNKDKTFTHGHFRESCGGDYFLGSNVRPFYVKTIPTTTSEWIRCINGVRRVGSDNNLGYWRTNNFKRFWYWCIAHIPRAERLFAPIHYGDTAIGTCRESLYKLSYNRTYTINGRKCKYPNDGLHSSGHPYSGWYIETYALKSTNSGVSFGETINGLKAGLISRLVSLDSAKGSGLRTRLDWFDDNKVRLSKPVMRLGYLPFFEKNDYVVTRVRSPYFSAPPAPNEDMDALFAHLGSDNQLFDTDEVVRRGQIRYENAISRVLDLLKGRVQALEQIRASVREMELNFH